MHAQVERIDALINTADAGGDGFSPVVQLHPILTRLTLDIICQVGLDSQLMGP